MKFEFINEFIAQKTDRQSEFDELVRREASALEDVHALKAEYEKTIRESLVERKDATKALDSLSEKIEAATKTHARRNQEREMYSQVVKPKITADDVVAKFNTEFAPEFKKEMLDPQYARLLAVKREFIEAVLAYRSVMGEFNQEKSQIRNQLSDHHYYQLAEIEHQTQAATDHYFITKQDLYLLSIGSRPDFNPERKV